MKDRVHYNGQYPLDKTFGISNNVIVEEIYKDLSINGIDEREEVTLTYNRFYAIYYNEMRLGSFIDEQGYKALEYLDLRTGIGGYISDLVDDEHQKMVDQIYDIIKRKYERQEVHINGAEQ